MSTAQRLRNEALRLTATHGKDATILTTNLIDILNQGAEELELLDKLLKAIGEPYIGYPETKIEAIARVLNEHEAGKAKLVRDRFGDLWCLMKPDGEPPYWVNFHGLRERTWEDLQSQGPLTLVKVVDASEG